MRRVRAEVIWEGLNAHEIIQWGLIIVVRLVVAVVVVIVRILNEDINGCVLKSWSWK